MTIFISEFTLGMMCMLAIEIAIVLIKAFVKGFCETIKKNKGDRK